MKTLKTVILVDDDEVAICLNETVIKSLDFCSTLYAFPNAVQGLNFFKELCSEDECPELILLDLKMPVIDGFEFLKEFESFFPVFRQRTKVILLTSSNSEQDKAMANMLGFDDYIVKPLTFDKVNNILSKHFSSPSCHSAKDLRTTNL